MTDWTPEKLDALPEGTVIEVDWVHGAVERMVSPGEGRWSEDLNARPEDCDATPEDLVGNSLIESIRVVSVPIDALLSSGAADTVSKCFGSWFDWDLMGEDAVALVRAAIAHVTGEAS